MDHSLSRSFGGNAPSGFPSATFGEVVHPHVQRASRLVERELSAAKPAVKPLLTFALQLTVGATAAIGTIMAIFAWSGAGL
jgi:hypothetical protein